MFTRGGPTFLELMQQALSSTDRGYDLLAPKFDLTPFRTPDALLSVAGTILSAGGPVPRAIDLCCGTGAGLRMLRPLCTDAVVGIDRSAGMLAEARRQSAGAGARVLLVRGDVLAPPLHETFDIATCFGAFGHILEQDEPRFVAAVHGLLRPGGRFAFFTSGEPSMRHPGYWLAKGFNAAIRLRNALIQPPFHMYYLTFMLPRATALLQAQGFSVEVHERVAPHPFTALPLVVATRGG
jgi:SAM-dependent methyltransferase